MFYLASYALMNIGAFAVISHVAARNEQFVKIDDLAGLGRREPTMAALLSIFVFSLIGVPLTSGFFGKFYVFQAALDSHLVWLTVIGLLNSAIAAYYYLKIIVAVYMREPAEQSPSYRPVSPGLRIALWASASACCSSAFFPRPYCRSLHPRQLYFGSSRLHAASLGLRATTLFIGPVDLCSTSLLAHSLVPNADVKNLSICLTTSFFGGEQRSYKQRAC